MTERVHNPGMGSRLRPLLLATSIISFPAAVLAQPVDGLYVGAGAGANIMSDETLKSLTVPSTFLPATGGVIPLNGQRLDGHIKMNGGFSGEISIGYGFGELTSFGGPRLELEGNYMSNGFEGVGLGGGNVNIDRFSASGQEQKTACSETSSGTSPSALPISTRISGRALAGSGRNGTRGSTTG